MRVLILCFADWHGPARLPWALKRAGWEVAVYCRRTHMVSKSAHVDRFFFAHPRNEVESIGDLLNVLDVFKPTIIIPGMEAAVVALLKILQLWEAGRLPALGEDGAALIRRSIFDPSKRRYFESKIDLLEAMKARGVRIPPQREIYSFGDADAFVQEHGYPVVLKPDRGFAGTGIAFCDDEVELIAALRERIKPGTKLRWAIQKTFPPMTAMYQMVAREGKVVCGYSLLRARTHPGNTGPSSVVQLIKNEDMDRAGVELADLLGYNGFGSIQFMAEDEGMGPVYMIESNMRIGTTMHLGHMFGPDLSTALFESLAGLPVAQVEPNLGVTVALYPQEVFRDPSSPFLDGIVDIPQSDPELTRHFEESISGRESLPS